VLTNIYFFLELWQADAISLGFSLPAIVLRIDLVVLVFELEVANCNIIRQDVWSVYFAYTVDYIVGHYLTLTLFSLLLSHRYQLEVDLWVFLATANTETLMPLCGETHATIDLGWVAAVFENDDEFFRLGFVACVEDGFEVEESQVVAVKLHSISYFAVNGVMGDIGFKWLRVVKRRELLFNDRLYSWLLGVYFFASDASVKFSLCYFLTLCGEILNSDDCGVTWTLFSVLFLLGCSQTQIICFWIAKWSSALLFDDLLECRWLFISEWVYEFDGLMSLWSTYASRLIHLIIS